MCLALREMCCVPSKIQFRTKIRENLELNSPVNAEQAYEYRDTKKDHSFIEIYKNSCEIMVKLVHNVDRKLVMRKMVSQHQNVHFR